MPKSSRSCSRGKRSVTRTLRSGKRSTYCRTSNPKNWTRGWKKIEPRKGRERNWLTQNCSRGACFLMPKAQKFPVCARGSCQPDCRALLSAKIRAKQYGYEGIAKRAQSIARGLKCHWAK